jgi:vacuolar-type H+-ATPase subunit H
VGGVKRIEMLRIIKAAEARNRKRIEEHKKTPAG